MKDLLRECISILVACCLALQCAPCCGQTQTTTAASAQEVQAPARQEISKDDVIARFHELQQQSATIQLLDRKLKSLNFVPAAAAVRYWGQSATYQRKTEERSESLIAAIYIHDYAKQNSKDGAALVQVTLTSSSGTIKTDSFYLVAPNGDVKKAQEYAVINHTITLRHSWWSCVRGQLVGVGGACALSTTTCLIPAAIAGTFSWAAYGACVAGACAGAFVKAGLCCSCDGGSICSIFVGTCHSGDGGSGGTPPPPGTCQGTKHCCEFNAKGQCTQCLSRNQLCP